MGGEAERRFAPVGYLALDTDRTGKQFTPFCTATLIAPRVVATAAHCVHETKLSVTAGGPFMTFATGATTSTTRAPSYVSAIYEDPGYDPTRPDYFETQGYQNDIALLVLEAPMEGVKPAEIASADQARDHLAVGYGRTKTGPYDLVEEGPPKRKSLRMTITGGSPESFYVASPDGGAVCYGDSGGPLLEIVSADGAPARAAIVGVLASMKTLDPENTCVPGTETYYASLSAKKTLVDQVLAAASGSSTGEASLTLPTGKALPLGPSDVLRIGSASDMEVMSAWHVAPDGSVDLYFDRGNAESTAGTLFGAHSPDGRKFTTPSPLALGPLGTATLVAGPSVVSRGALEASLYFIASNDVQSAPTIGRAQILPGGRVAAAEALPAIRGVDWAYSWPNFFAAANGAVGLAFRDGRGIPHFSASADGKQFATPIPVSPTQGAMADAGELPDGAFVYTYQVTTQTEAMVSMARISRDARTWSAPIRITTASPNVHDTSILPRTDGKGADLYYIYPPDDHGFSLYRRSITSAGVLGPEERITASEAGSPSKPKATHLPNGHVLVSYADITKRSVEGWPAVQQLVVAELPGDAP